jgi:uncharacterized protein YqeY
MIEQIEKDLVEAMKAHDEKILSVLRMLKSAVKNSEIQKKAELKDEDILGLIQGQIKQRQDSINLYEQGGRQELAEKEKQEIEVLKKYLPEQIDETQIRAIVQEAITATSASSIQDMGKVMAKLMPEVKGKADGSLVSQIVKEELSK